MKDFSKSLKFIWKYGKNNKGKIILYSFICIFRVTVSVFFPILSANIIINLTENKLEQLFFLAIILFLLNILNQVVTYFGNIIATKMFVNISNSLEDDLGKEILRIDNKSLDNNSSGIFIQRLTNDVERLSDVFWVLLEQVGLILTGIGTFVAIFIINKIVFVYVILSLIIVYLLNKKRLKVRQENRKLTRDKREKLTGFISELVRGARDIKMLNSEGSFSKELNNRVTAATSMTYKTDVVNQKYMLLQEGVRHTLDFILIALLILLINKNVLLATSALILYNYSERIGSFVHNLNNSLQYIKDFVLSSSNIMEILEDNKFTKEKFGDIHLEKAKGDFEFKDVTFRYNKNGRKILDKINFKVKANETVAFVGKTGAGKTTIFNLLCKMYDVTGGEIKIDGINVNELDKDSIRGNITIISQNPYIFNVSIKDNLKLVKKDVTDEEIKKACKMACLDKFINKLPDKYDTIVGEGGVTLSGGEKQRLAIARALIQKTGIILFDEATSALDNETQAHIQQAIENMKREYTILIIAHRLSTIINADRILFLNNGKIEAKGSHKQLLKTCKDYKELYENEIRK